MLNWLKSKVFKRRVHQSNVANTHAGASQSISGEAVDIDQLMTQGFAFFESNQIEKAELLFQKILVENPQHSDALYLLGLVFKQQGNTEGAITLINQAIRYKSDEPEFYRALGQTLFELKRTEEAIPHFENALKLDPACVTTLTSISSAYRLVGNLRAALKCLTEAIDIAPTCWPALNTRGEILLQCGRVNQAIADYQKSFEINPENSSTFRVYLFATNYSMDMSPKDIFAEHIRYDKLFGVGKFGHAVIEANNPDPNRKLRIGYLSPDFFNHVVSFFVLPILTHHDVSQFETFGYHIDNIKDEVTDQLKSLSNHWTDCYDWTTEAIVEKIRSDKIDILIDLAGHTSNSRLDIFAARSAPIQMTWLGYINTTGLSAMDYRIVDCYSDPEGVSEIYHSEQLLRLPNTQWCFNKPKQAIQVSELPALSNGFITFGSFNKYSKLSEKVLSLWVRLLSEITDARLLIVDVPEVELDTICEFFIHRGIDIKRLEFYGRTSLETFRELHLKVDIALDSHPYSGGTTTCESLWMGVPTLTLTGATSISRSTSSLMQTLGLNDWIAQSDEEFCEAARLLTSNLGNLSSLRNELRSKLESSPIMNAAQFTKDLEHAYRQVWIRKCQENSLKERQKG